MSYKIGFDGVVTADLDRLLQSVEKGVNGFGLHVQGTDMEASAVASGSTTQPCPSGHTCSDSVKGGHDFRTGHDAVVIVIAIVGGAVAGYVAGKKAAQRVLLSVKGGHD
jgi:hypothetical protein